MHTPDLPLHLFFLSSPSFIKWLSFHLLGPQSLGSTFCSQPTSNSSVSSVNSAFKLCSEWLLLTSPGSASCSKPSHFYKDYCSDLFSAVSVRGTLWTLSQILSHIWSKPIIGFLTLRAKLISTIGIVFLSLTSLPTILSLAYPLQQYCSLCCL